MFRKLFGWCKGSEKKQNPEAVRLGIDLEMMYCPSCGDEYRSGIARCVGCSVDLITGVEKLEQTQRKSQAFLGRSMDISEDEPRVVVRKGKLRDLKPHQFLLAKDRIPALITGEAGGCGKG